MITIKEDFVSFETAKLLKEKNCPDFGYSCICDSEGNKAQTQSIIMKWLREKYNLFIQITVDFSDGAYPMYDVCVVDLARCTSIIVNGYNRYTYTQACEAAIKYCLENLI